MPRASEVKKNAAIEFEGRVYFVKDIERSVPQGRAGGSLYRMRLYDVVTNSKKDETFKDGDMLNLADLTRRTASFSYADGEEYVFMDTEDYTQYMLNKEAIAEELLFVTEETQGIMVVLIKDAPVALALPPTVDFEIADTAPSVKGGSATARTKPATMVTGLVIQVPEYISTGDRIKVNVEERRFMGRATAE
jgi:elongation factor P